MSDEGTEADWQRLHPASVLVNLVPRAWRVLRGSWPILLALLYGRRGDATALFDLALLLFFFATTIGGTLLHWLTLRYRVAGGRLEIESGLVFRQARTLDPSRIQNVELVRNVFHKLSGLVEVRIETASGREVEGMLSALDEASARALMAALDAARSKTLEVAAEAPESEAIIDVGAGALVKYGATAFSPAMLLVLFGLGFEAMQVFGDADDVGDRLARVGVALGGVALVLAAWGAGVAAALVRHWRFRLTRVGRTLVAEEGLFTRRRVELRPGKVQTLTVEEPLLRRLLRFASVRIRTAAASSEAGGTETAEALVPVVGHDALGAVVARVAPEAGDLDAVAWRRPHPRALVREVSRALMRTSLLVALAVVFFDAWGLLVALWLVPALAFAVLDHRTQGWYIGDDVILARQGFVRRRTTVMPRRKVQSVQLLQGPLLRRTGLARLLLLGAGSSIALPLLAAAEAEALVRPLARGALGPPSPPPPAPPAPATAPAAPRTSSAP